MNDEKIKVRDIPLTITLGELCENVRCAYQIMELIHAGKYPEASCRAGQLLNMNDALIEKQIDKAAVLRLLNQSIS